MFGSGGYEFMGKEVKNHTHALSFAFDRVRMSLGKVRTRHKTEGLSRYQRHAIKADRGLVW